MSTTPMQPPVPTSLTDEIATAQNAYVIAQNSIPAGQSRPVTIADGADVTLGGKADVAGASAAVANQTGMSRLSGIWTVLGSLTDAAATVWDNTSNSISSLLRGIGGNIAKLVPQGSQVAVDINRPNDTVPYSAGDVAGGVSTGYQTIPSVGPAACLAYLTDLQRQTFLTALPSGMTSFTYHFYDAQPTDIADNSPWVPTAADQPHYLGNITTNNMAAVGSGANAMVVSQNSLAVLLGSPLGLKLAAGQTSLWYFAVTNGGYTPTASARKITRFSFITVPVS